MEAGHRCAIPTCRQITLEVVHITPWAKVKEHTFDNLIALCPNCHTRVHKGEIDRKALKQYKANLSILNGRYGDLERRVLDYFAEHPDKERILLPRGFDILLMYLLKDGLLEDVEKIDIEKANNSALAGAKWYQLTSNGRNFIQRWLSAKKLQ